MGWGVFSVLGMRLPWFGALIFNFLLGFRVAKYDSCVQGLDVVRYGFGSSLPDLTFQAGRGVPLNSKH